MTDASQRLISRLVEDLEPVRPLPPIRQAFAWILALWAALLGVVLWSKQGELGVSFLFENRIYLASFSGLVVAAIGGTTSALAAGIPGRERLEGSGMLLALVGLAAAALACGIGIASLGALAPASPEGVDAKCFGESALLSLLPAGVILGFLVRGWAAKPVRAAWIALLGAGALGALIVHVSCSFLAPRHLLVSHLSVPVVLALLGVYPLAVMLRRIRR
jgi:uncharacterized membrane protein